MLKRKKTQDVSRNSVPVLYEAQEYAYITEEVAQFWDVKLKSRPGSRAVSRDKVCRDEIYSATGGPPKGYLIWCSGARRGVVFMI